MTSMGGGGGVRQLLGYAGLVLLALVLLNLLVRRLGGWKRLFGWFKREISRTVHAFTDPVTAWVRYRRRLRFLAGVLRDHTAWSDAQRATSHAAGLDASMAPYALALTKRRIGVLVAGAGPERPLPSPWERDETDPRLWWIRRADLIDYTGPAGATAGQLPLLICVGVGADGRSAIMLDLLAGPSSLSVYGVPRTARAVVQALAAQLDVRLPAGAVEVADGVHHKHDGMPLSDAVRRPGAWFVVGAEALDTPLPPGIRLVSLGLARGSSWLVEATTGQALRLHGAASWLDIDPLPLAKAVARSVRRMPPHDFDLPDPAGPATTPTDDFEDLDQPVGPAGISVLGSVDESARSRRSDVPSGKASAWN